MNPSTIIALVQADLFEREKRGLNKYGTTVDRKDLSELEWLQHAYEEALDLAVYLKKTIQSKKGVEEISESKLKIGDEVVIKKTGIYEIVDSLLYGSEYQVRLSNGRVYKFEELELIEE